MSQRGSDTAFWLRVLIGRGVAVAGAIIFVGALLRLGWELAGTLL